MSQQNVTAFFTSASSDPALQAEISRILDGSTPRADKATALAELSQKSDTPFTAEDVLAAYASHASAELSDADLDNVAGGRGFRQPSSYRETGIEKL